MLEPLLFIAVFVILLRMWGRLQTLERRIAAGEFHYQPAPSHGWRGPDLLPQAMPAPPAEPAIRTAPTAEPFADAEPEQQQPAAPPHFDPVPELPDEAAPQPRGGIGMEELFGRRLPIWAGGVTLAVAGVLIVRYSIDAGLLSPLVRFIGGLLFGAVLIAAAEVALRFESLIRDARVRQSLAGAGIATLYASIVAATNLHALIGPMTAFLALAAVTAAALGLSLRFGPPSALLGLVGGLAAPALVGASEPNVPLLTLYLALAVAGLSILSRVQRWAWLGVSALAGGLGWGLVLTLSGMLDTAATLSIGLYLLVVGILLPVVALPGGGGRLLRLAGSIAAAAQMAALVASGGFSLLHWGLSGLISLAILWVARREQGFGRLPAVGLALALLLLGAWPQPAPGEFALVLIGAVVIYGGAALQALWLPRGGLVEAAMIAALALGAAALAAAHYYRADHSADLILAAIALAASCLPAAAALLGWTKAGRRTDSRFAVLVSAAGLLVSVAAAFAIPLPFLPPVIGCIAVALLQFSRSAEDERIEWAALPAALVTVPLLAAASGAETEFARLFGLPAAEAGGAALLRWGSLALAAAFFAWRHRERAVRAAAQAGAAVLAYGTAAQLVPADILPVVAALALPALAVTQHRFGGRFLFAALKATFAIAIGWAALPLLLWGAPALASLGGNPLLVTELPAVSDALTRLLIPGLLIGAGAWISRGQLDSRARAAAIATAATLAAVAAHILFKRIFGMTAQSDFVNFAMAERLVWQLLLLGLALVALRLNARRVALGLGAAGVAHLGWYSLTLHNPLWAEQAVGAVPLVNLLTGTYGLALALLALAPRLAAFPARAGSRRAAAQMILITLLAYSALRQVFHGSILTVSGLSQSEDIARSIVAVALALGCLLWGIRTGSRDWRIGSLILMLGAVAKVFLFDASGLEGLMRIASFIALGASLIGIGWLYSRSLRPDAPLTAVHHDRLS